MTVASNPALKSTAKGSRIACSLGRALQLVGDRWVLMIIHSAFLGNTRFSDIRRATGMARSLLTRRLQRMEQSGLIERRLYDDRLQRFEYILTSQGVDLIDTAMMIVRWERLWHNNNDVITLNIQHKQCGHDFIPAFCCSACSQVIDPEDVELKDGPGAGLEQRVNNDVRRSSITDPDINGSDALLGWAGVILGDRWTPALICSPSFGLTRFNDIQRFWEIAPNILSDRLARLVELGVMNQNVYIDDPSRFQYELTEKGRSFIPVLLTLMSWGDRWLSSDKGPPYIQLHKACGKKFTPVIRCDQCNKKVGVKDVAYNASPV